MVGTSNLGSWNGHWSKGRFQVQFAFSSTVRITPQGTDALRGQVLAGGHLQPSDWGWWPPIKMVTTGDGWWNWAYHMSKIWVCYFFWSVRTIHWIGNPCLPITLSCGVPFCRAIPIFLVVKKGERKNPTANSLLCQSSFYLLGLNASGMDGLRFSFL